MYDSLTVPALRWMPGDTIRQRDAQRRMFDYTLLSTQPYQTKGGGASALLTWRGCCAICGTPFTTQSGRRPRQLVRTCPAHRGWWTRGGAYVG